jgi:hypothetical protein
MMKKNIKPSLWVALISLLFLSFACGSGDDKNDQLLAAYEKLVVKYEQAAQRNEPVSSAELEALQKETADFANKMQGLQNGEGLSAAQMEKMQDLARRLMTARQDIETRE